VRQASLDEDYPEGSSPLQGILAYERKFGCSKVGIEYVEGKGRMLVARERIPARTVILEEPGLVSQTLAPNHVLFCGLHLADNSLAYRQALWDSLDEYETVRAALMIEKSCPRPVVDLALDLCASSTASEDTPDSSIEVRTPGGGHYEHCGNILRPRVWSLDRPCRVVPARPRADG
jgi:hypothetical protein